MAARLEWHGDELKLGGRRGWTLGAVRKKERGMWFAVPNRDAETRTGYERVTDAMQDLESEVRRLLKEAGVVLE